MKLPIGRRRRFPKAQGEKEMADGDYAKAVDTLLDAQLDPDNKEVSAEEQGSSEEGQVGPS